MAVWLGPAAGGGNDAIWVWLCRRYTSYAPTTRTFRDMALIALNPNNGKICFFASRRDAERDGTRIPKPEDDAVASKDERGQPSSYKFWGTFADTRTTNCVSCHPNGITLSSWMAQVKDRDGNLPIPTYDGSRLGIVQNAEVAGPPRLNGF